MTTVDRRCYFKIWACDHLDLPKEMTDIIKEMFTSLLGFGQTARRKKALVSTITRSYCRRRGYTLCKDICQYFGEAIHKEHDNHETDEHWGFWSGRNEDPQLQAVSCRICGNYIYSNTPSPRGGRCICEMI